MIRLVVTDMDGTLLNDAHQLPQGIWEAIDELHEKGILFAVASGRQYKTLADIFAPVADKMLFMAENGTYVVYQGKALWTESIPRPMWHDLVKTARKVPKTHVVLCGTETAYIESKDEKFLAEVAKYYHYREVVDDLLEIDAEILKYCLCDYGDPVINSYPAFLQYEPHFNPVVSSKIWLDVMQQGSHKGKALKAMLEKLQISNEEAVVFGDYMNDFEMMQFAQNSYAMANAHPEIMKIARFTTQFDNNNNGVLSTLKELQLLRSAL